MTENLMYPPIITNEGVFKRVMPNYTYITGENIHQFTCYWSSNIDPNFGNESKTTEGLWRFPSISGIGDG